MYYDRNIKIKKMEQATTLDVKPLFDAKLAQAAYVGFKALYSDNDAEGDRNNIVSQVISEKGENKEKAFSLLIGFGRTGLISSDAMVTAIDKVPPTEKAKVPLLIKSFMEVEPTDTTAIALMESVKNSNPELLGEIIEGKKAWKKSDIRRQIKKYTYSEELWYKLEKIEEDLISRK